MKKFLKDKILDDIFNKITDDFIQNIKHNNNNHMSNKIKVIISCLSSKKCNTKLKDIMISDLDHIPKILCTMNKIFLKKDVECTIYTDFEKDDEYDSYNHCYYNFKYKEIDYSFNNGDPVNPQSQSHNVLFRIDYKFI